MEDDVHIGMTYWYFWPTFAAVPHSFQGYQEIKCILNKNT